MQGCRTVPMPSSAMWAHALACTHLPAQVMFRPSQLRPHEDAVHLSCQEGAFAVPIRAQLPVIELQVGPACMGSARVVAWGWLCGPRRPPEAHAAAGAQKEERAVALCQHA